MWMKNDYMLGHSLCDVGDSKGFSVIVNRQTHRPWTKNEGVAELSVGLGIKELEQSYL